MNIWKLMKQVPLSRVYRKFGEHKRITKSKQFREINRPLEAVEWVSSKGPIVVRPKAKQ